MTSDQYYVSTRALVGEGCRTTERSSYYSLDEETQKKEKSLWDLEIRGGYGLRFIYIGRP